MLCTAVFASNYYCTSWFLLNIRKFLLAILQDKIWAFYKTFPHIEICFKLKAIPEGGYKLQYCSWVLPVSNRKTAYSCCLNS